MKLETSSVKGLLINLGLILGVLSLAVVIFFYLWLPDKTNHGETITVPDLYKHKVEDLEELLIDRKLTFEVSDSVFDSEYPPYTILHQYPEAGKKVKEGRKIFISVNRSSAPKVELPPVLDGKSITHVQAVLSNLDIQVNKIITRRHPYPNLVLEILLNGEPIEEGQSIAQGSEVDVVIGDGYGATDFEMPNFYFQPWDEVSVTLKGLLLNLEPLRIPQGVDTTGADLFVVDQDPLPTEEVKTGEYIRITVSDRRDSSYWDVRVDTLAVPVDTTVQELQPNSGR